MRSMFIVMRIGIDPRCFDIVKRVLIGWCDAPSCMTPVNRRIKVNVSGQSLVPYSKCGIGVVRGTRRNMNRPYGR
jgi:hypothetical protein